MATQDAVLVNHEHASSTGEQQRLAVALAIIQARRQGSRSREWQRRAEQAEQALAAHQRVLTSLLQLNGQQQDEQLQALLHGIAASGPLLHPDQGSDVAQGLATTLAHLQAASTWEQQLAPSQKLLQQRRAGLDMLLGHARTMRLIQQHLAAPSGAPPATTMPSAPLNADLQALLSFISDTLLHLPASDLQRSYLQASITCLAALLNSSAQQQRPCIKDCPTTQPVLFLMQQLVSATVKVPTTSHLGSGRAPCSEAARAALSAIQQHASLGPLLLLGTCEALHTAVQQILCLSRDLAPAIADHLAASFTLPTSLRAHNPTCATPLMQQLSAQHCAVAGLVRLAGTCVQVLPCWFQACAGERRSSQPPHAVHEHSDAGSLELPAVLSQCMQALETSCGLLIGDFTDATLDTLCGSGTAGGSSNNNMVAVGLRSLAAQLAATQQHMVMMVGSSTAGHSGKCDDGHVLAMQHCKERLIGMCMRLRAALAPSGPCVS